jgi:hypothetical protein
MQQDAQLRAGDVREAIETARLSLRLGRAVQEGPLIAGLVGLAIRALPVTTFGRHVDPMNAADPGRLVTACREWLREPDPFPGMIAAERRWSRRIARDHVEEPERFNAALDRLLDRVLVEWKKPAWQRARLALPADESVEGQMVARAAWPMEQSVDLFTRDRAQIRLLAVHAALRRYRLEQGRLPESLDALRLGDLAIDPFTGKPFQYRAADGVVRLRSVGPRAEPGDARAVERRRPVSVTPEK